MDRKRQWHKSAFRTVAQVPEIERCSGSGADPNARTEDGSTPLHSATLNRTCPTVIPALIACGADLSIRDAHWMPDEGRLRD